jgi:hypothetical protein
VSIGSRTKGRIGDRIGIRGGGRVTVRVDVDLASHIKVSSIGVVVGLSMEEEQRTNHTHPGHLYTLFNPTEA